MSKRDITNTLDPFVIAEKNTFGLIAVGWFLVSNLNLRLLAIFRWNKNYTVTNFRMGEAASLSVAQAGVEAAK